MFHTVDPVTIQVQEEIEYLRQIERRIKARLNHCRWGDIPGLEDHLDSVQDSIRNLEAQLPEEG